MKTYKKIILIAFTMFVSVFSSRAQEEAINAATLLETSINEQGLAKTQNKFGEIFSNRDKFIIKENEINSLAYRFLFLGQLSNALEVFKMNVTLFPKSTNVYDSQGEAYLYLGDIPKAIESYSKISELENGNTSGTRIIENINQEYRKRQNDKLRRFHIAAKSGNLQSLQLWLKANPDFLNKKTNDGNTALYLSVYGKHLDLVKYLVSAGADLNIRNTMGQSAYNLAESCKFETIKDFLLSKNTDRSPQEFPLLESEYLGQKEPGLKPELFAEGIVSTHRNVYGNIVFSPDFKEACWTPNEPGNDHQHGGLIISKVKDGRWSPSEEVFFLDPESYSHRSPFYSYDGNRLYFQGYRKTGVRSFDQKEKFYFVAKTENTWSEPSLLDTIFNNYGMHWQFSLDRKNNLYFGGKNRSIENSGGIYLSQFIDGKYTEPVLQIPNEQLKEAIFAPAISPDGDYMLFIRILPRGSVSPRIFSLYVCFHKEDGSWTNPQDVGELLNMGSNQPRISHDGKYIFFIEHNKTYWVSSKIIEKLKPKI